MAAFIVLSLPAEISGSHTRIGRSLDLHQFPHFLGPKLAILGAWSRETPSKPQNDGTPPRGRWQRGGGGGLEPNFSGFVNLAAEIPPKTVELLEAKATNGSSILRIGGTLVDSPWDPLLWTVLNGGTPACGRNHMKRGQKALKRANVGRACRAATRVENGPQTAQICPVTLPKGPRTIFGQHHC